MKNEPHRQMYLRDDARHLLRTVCDDLWKCRDRIEDEKLNHLPLRDDERKALETLTNAGYELLGWGIGRIVLRMPSQGGLDNFVVKIGRYGNEPISIGMWQNREEVLLWTEVENKEWWPLLPTLDWQEEHIRWLVMPFGTPLDSESIDESKREDLLRKSKDKLSQLDCLNSQELVPQNFVIWNDKVWLADYGRNTVGSV